MSKEVESVPKIGTDGKLLPVLPPERDPRLSIRVIRVMFYVPGFTALLLLKTGEPTGFGITIEFLMLASAASVVAGLFIATQSSGGSSDNSSRVGLWSGALVLELMGVVSFLYALPSLFHQLANSELLHKLTPGATPVALGASELIPTLAIIPFMLYQLAGFGTLHYVVSRPVNWAINLAILVLTVGSYIANREASFGVEKAAGGLLVILMVATVIYGVFELKRMQAQFDAHRPPKLPKRHADEPQASP
jgi:riboflavin transporter FmnP